jgi:23S rRNA-/tRNA-specific pseudouridylate synthase
MYALGHPIVGDTLYRQKGVTPRDIGRIFLHAKELTVALPSGEEKTFEAPLPADLEQVLEDIPKL